MKKNEKNSVGKKTQKKYFKISLNDFKLVKKVVYIFYTRGGGGGGSANPLLGLNL